MKSRLGGSREGITRGPGQSYDNFPTAFVPYGLNP